MKASASNLLAKLPGKVSEKWPQGERFARAFAHGSMSVEFYAPVGTDPQTPHEQDELYSIHAGVEIPPPAPALFEGYKHVFQARKSAYWLTLRERITHWKPDGSSKEELPKTKVGSRLDMVRFNDFFLMTNDDELADAIKASALYGTEFWSYSDKVKEQAAAQAAEIRAALEANPELKKALKLTPSDAKDWDLKPKMKAPEPSLEELEAMTRPDAT